MKLALICSNCSSPFLRERGEHNRDLKNGVKSCCSKSCSVLLRKTAPERRFWDKVDKTPGHGPNGDCWVWTAGADKDGYGNLTANGRKFRAHRYSFLLANGYLNDKLCVCHECDNPSCVNPKHLWQGTVSENNEDRDLKKGNTFMSNPQQGEGNYQSVLTENQVREIVRLGHLGMKVSKIALKFNICKGTVLSIFNGKIWAHLDLDLNFSRDKRAEFENILGKNIGFLYIESLNFKGKGSTRWNYLCRCGKRGSLPISRIKTRGCCNIQKHRALGDLNEVKIG